MDDEIKTLDDLRRALLSVELPPRDPLAGFDPEIVGFDCAGNVEAGDWQCPFIPGCGQVPGPQCELMQLRAGILATAFCGAQRHRH